MADIGLASSTTDNNGLPKEAYCMFYTLTDHMTLTIQPIRLQLDHVLPTHQSHCVRFIRKFLQQILYQ